MLLFVDAGNTRVKWGLLAVSELPQIEAARQAASLQFPLHWLRQGACAHAQLPELVAQLQGVAIHAVHVSNVAGAAIQQQLQTLLHQIAPHCALHRLLASSACAGLKNAYAEPTQLGSDRFASAIAAQALFPQRPVLVATCGTATTVDAINADGVFIGGMILPGLQLMAKSLAQNTAQLPQIDDPRVVQPMFADHTQQAIVNGCIQAQVGAIERAYRAFASAQNAAPACIISGGAASYLMPHLSASLSPQLPQSMDALVLTGLAIAAASTAAAEVAGMGQP